MRSVGFGWKSARKLARLALACGLAIVVGAGPAAANLFITPVRVVFTDQDRSAEIVLVNRSTETTTYRVEWQEKRALPTGGYETIKEPGPEFIGANTLVRFSPRQVTLGPGEQQQVRLSYSPNPDLPSGEYRSHLALVALGGAPGATAGAPAGGGQGIQLTLNLSFAIPIIVRIGDEGSGVRVSEARFLYDQAQRLKVAIDMTRDGPYSTYGDISVYWRPDATTPERKIGALNNLAIHADVLTRSAEIALTETSLSQGILRISYVGRAEYAGRNWFDQSLRIGN